MSDKQQDGKISEAVVRRLPIYLRFLNEMNMQQIQTVSSKDLGNKLGMNPAQIRKDLNYFGEFGKKGIGYDVQLLITSIRHILKLDQKIDVGLVGAGNLGHALCNYNMYQKDNMKISAIFDNAEHKVGEQINHLTVQPLTELARTVKEKNIRMGIITVPSAAAQMVADELVSAGVNAILNFAPVIIKAPDDIRVQHADFTAELHSLSYYLD